MFTYIGLIGWTYQLQYFGRKIVSIFITKETEKKQVDRGCRKTMRSKEKKGEGGMRRRVEKRHDS